MKAQTIMCACGLVLLLLAGQTQALETTIPVTTNNLQSLQIVFSQPADSAEPALATQPAATTDSQSLQIVFGPSVGSTASTLETLTNARLTMDIPFAQGDPGTMATTPEVAAVPEPGTLALMGLGVLGLLSIVRRKRAL